MNFHKYLIKIIIMISALIACNAMAGPKKPQVSFESPSVVLVEGYDSFYVVVEASTRRRNVTIESVQLYIDDQFIRKEILTPYEWGDNERVEMLGLSVGDHVVKAVATDSRGLTGEATLSVTVTPNNDLVKPPKGRLAIVSDGNSPDPDDIGANATIFGILSATNLSDKLVHFSHSCDIDPFKNPGSQVIDAENELRRQQILQHVADESVNLWGPFVNLRDSFNCRADLDGAINDLVDAINLSTTQNPLWIVEAGEPDLIGYALEASEPAAREYVHVISHHPANDNSGDYFTWQEILDFGVTEHQIGDQNVMLKTPMSSWDWAENHGHDGIAFIWDMLAYAESDGVVSFQTGKFDCSDAGMVYWWITGADASGNKLSTTSDMKEMLLLAN